MISREVEFIWWSNRKVWTVKGKTIEEITEKAERLCDKYHAIHFQILD